MKIAQSLFWDIKPGSLDPDKQAWYIIPRVMDYGTLEDVKIIREYYGEERIREILLQTPSLHRKTISFFAWKYGLPRTAFRAYRRKLEWKTWR